MECCFPAFLSTFVAFQSNYKMYHTIWMVLILFRADSTGEWSRVYQGFNTYWIIVDLLVGDSYSFRVKASNDDYEGEYSPTSQATFLPNPSCKSSFLGFFSISVIYRCVGEGLYRPACQDAFRAAFLPNPWFKFSCILSMRIVCVVVANRTVHVLM